jgi:MFS family permease
LYTVPLFGPQLADHLHYSLLELNIIATAGDYGVYLSGPLFGALVDKRGPRIGSLLAMGLLLGGYSLMSWTYSHGEGVYASYMLMAVYFLMMGLGSSCAYMAALSTTTLNFPATMRGLVLGVVIACFGLSAFGVSLLDAAFFAGGEEGPDTGGLLMWMGVLTGLANLVCVFGLQRVEPVDVQAPLLEDSEHYQSIQDEEIEEGSVVEVLFKNPNFWLVFVALVVIAGCGLMYINNVGSMASTLFPNSPGDVQRARNLHVATFSISSFSARLAFGMLSDWTGGGLSRLVWMATTALGMMTGMLGAAMTTEHIELLPWTIVVGLSYGGVFTLTPTIVSEWWGSKNIGRNWGWMAWAPAMGGLLFNSLFGYVFDLNSPTNPKDPTRPRRCKDGNACYMQALFLASSLCILALACIVLVWKRRKND